MAAEDKSHISILDEAMLQRLAVEGRGGYIRSQADRTDVDEIYELIQQLFAKDVEGDVRRQLVNRFQWPLAIAVLCFTAEGLWLVILPWIRIWRERKRKRQAPREGAEYA